MANKPLYSATGVVEAPYRQVVDLLTAVRSGPVGPDNAFYIYHEGGPELVLRGGPEKFTAGVAMEPNGLHLKVDRERRTVAVEGQWWFRGECRVEPHPKGAHVVQEAFNVARTARWMVPFVRIGLAGKQQASMEELLQRIGRRLGCRAYLE